MKSRRVCATRGRAGAPVEHHRAEGRRQKTGSDSVQCSRFGNVSPAREVHCAFWEREPGADDESNPELWRRVMGRTYPCRPRQPLKPRTLAETRAIMGPHYVPIGPLADDPPLGATS